MARSVHLADDVYVLLSALKREGESFSDIVRRLAAERKDPLKLLELKPPRDDFDLERAREHARAAEVEKMDEMFGPRED